MKPNEIKAALLRRNLTLKMVAERLKVSCTTVSEEVQQIAPRSAWVRARIARMIGRRVAEVFPKSGRAA